MKNIAITVCSVIALVLPAGAETVPAAVSESVDADGSISGKAALNLVGPLHVSEGVVIIKDNQIDVLSDAADSIKEAELSGQLLHAHAVSDGATRTIKGIAYFTRGYSITALDAAGTNDSIQDVDGSSYVGHISGATSKSLRIDTSEGPKFIPIRKVTAIKSPRAFDFSIMTSNNPSSASGEASSVVPNRITFSPTCAPAANTASIALHASTTHRQLSERHLKKRLATGAVVMTAAAGCIAIPMGLAVFTPRPNK